MTAEELFPTKTAPVSGAAPRSVFDASAPIPNAPTPDDYVRGFADGLETDAPFFIDETENGAAKSLYCRRATSGATASDAERRFENERFADSVVAAVRERGVGIAGAGLMGISISAAFLGAGFPTLAFDAFPEALETASARVERELASQRFRRGVALSDSAAESAAIRETVARLFRTTGNLGDLGARPAVVETIPEKKKIKAKFYRELGAAATGPILLLSNASSIQISELGAALSSANGDGNVVRERFCGFHFFHPVAKRSLVEVVRGAKTAPETLVAARKLGSAISKTPILVGDGPGFLVNRLLQAFLNEGLALLDEGVSAARIEDVARRFGTEAGPLRIMDEIGLDVSMRAGWTFFKAFPERTLDSAILTELVREGKLGRKTRRGFYRFEGDASWKEDAVLDFGPETVAALRGASFEAPTTNADDKTACAKISDEEIAFRFAVAILFEGARLVDDGIVASFREADAGLVLALGFPPEKGGIFYWAASFGLRRILETAERLRGLGERFAAPESLRRLADAEILR